jgi:catechol 2,3-dioxygenase-like lactoylglutathione lyase family enzyme|tara:strand:+ start:208 stop:564 length:357 start_codon:yes stop_codon:yes gene_type:complete
MTPLKRIIIFVADVEKCANFYKKNFGLQPIEEGHQTGEWRELETGGSILAFHKAHGAAGPTGSEKNPHKLVFGVENIKKAREEFIADGIDMGNLMTFGNIVFCDGKDSEGYPFQISNR